MRYSTMLAGAAALCVSATAKSDEPNGDVSAHLGVRLVEAFADGDHIWVRNDEGVVIEFERMSGDARVLADRAVIDMERRRGQLLGLRERATDGSFELVDLSSQAVLSPPLAHDVEPIALLVGNEVTVLTLDALYGLVEGAWRRLELSASLRRAPQTSVAANDAGVVYIGYNVGEWGGGMQAIEADTGRVSEIRRIDGHTCDGPLGQECDPVTGIVQDARRPDCVFAAVGLSHGSANGRILRVCGDVVEIDFSQEIEPRDGEGFPRGSWPMFGLAATSDGWIAVSAGRLFRSSGGDVVDSEIPELDPWNGLHIAAPADDVLILLTDLNAARSLSGFTPLLVHVEE